jgi:hypothetical protein
MAKVLLTKKCKGGIENLYCCDLELGQRAELNTWKLMHTCEHNPGQSRACRLVGIHRDKVTVEPYLTLYTSRNPRHTKKSNTWKAKLYHSWKKSDGAYHPQSGKNLQNERKVTSWIALN